MKTKFARTTAIAFTALLTLSAVAVIAPSATAQGEQEIRADTKFVTHADKPLLPDTEQVILKVKTTLQIPAATGCVATVKVNWNKGAIPSYATMIFNPSSLTKPAPTSSGAAPTTGATAVPVEYDTEVSITINRDAPAFQDATYEVIAKVEASGTSSGTCNLKPPSQDSKASDVVKNGYFPLTNVNPQSLFIKSGQNKKVVFPVDLVNLGNGPTRVKIDLTPAGKNRLDSMNAGGEVRLESKAGKGASAAYKAQRNIEVQTPHSNGYTNSIYGFNARFTSSYDGPAQGTLLQDETTVTLTVQVQGVYVPGFDGSILIAALGIAMLGIARFARRSE